MPDQKEPIPSFAAKIKAKYPEYKDINDTILVNKIVEKYPEYKDVVDLSGVGTVKKKEQSTLSVSPSTSSATTSESSGLVALDVSDEQEKQFTENQKKWERMSGVRPNPKDPVGSIKRSLGHVIKSSLQDSRTNVSSTAVKKPIEQGLQEQETYAKAAKEVKQVENYFRYNTNNALNVLKRQTGLTDEQLYSPHYDEQIKQSIEKGNNTQQLSYQALQDAKKADAVIKGGGTIEDMAFRWAGMDDEQMRQINEVPLPLSQKYGEATRGRLIFDLSNNPAFQQEIKKYPELQSDLRQEAANISKNFPDFGKAYYGNMVSQEMENMGMNNGILNVVTKEEFDKVVDKLKAEGKITLAEEAFIKENLRGETGLKGLGKQIIGRESIATPGLIERAGQGLVGGFENLGKGVAEATGVYEGMMGGELPTAARDIEQANKQVEIKPQGLWHEVTQYGGQFGGQSLSIAGGGGLLKTLSIAKNPAVALGLSGGMQAYANYAPIARQLFPGEPWKQKGFATVMSGVEALTENIFNDEKVVRGLLSKIKPAVKNTIEDFTQKNISAAAARATIEGQVRNAINQLPEAVRLGAKAVGQNTAEEVIAEGLGQITQGVFEGKPMSEWMDAEALAETARQAFIGSVFIGALSARADLMKNRGITSKQIYLMARDPEYWANQMQETAKLDRDLESQLPDKLQNLQHATELLKELDSQENLTEKQKAKYLLTSLDSKIKQENLSQKIDPIIRAKENVEILKQVQENEKIQQDILEGKDDGNYEGDRSDDISKSEEKLLTTLKEKAGEFEKQEELQYFVDKAGEAPAQYYEKYGEETTNKLLEQVSTEKLKQNLDDVLNINPENPNVPILDKLIFQREANEAKENTQDNEPAESAQPTNETTTLEKFENKINDISKATGLKFHKSETTNSWYATDKDGKKIRISDHSSKFVEKQRIYNANKAEDLPINYYSTDAIIHILNGTDPFANYKKGDKITHSATKIGEVIYLGSDYKKGYVEVEAADGRIVKYDMEKFLGNQNDLNSPKIEKTVEGETTTETIGTTEEGGAAIPPTEPPVKIEGDESQPEFENKPKSILNRVFAAKNTSEATKEKFRDKGLSYKPQSHDEARGIAKEIVQEFGSDNAVSMAETGRFDGDVNSLIFAEAIDDTFSKEQNATTQEEKIKYAEQWADFAIRYDEAARSKGRFISAIADFYRKSPLGVVIAERAKRDEAFREWFTKREKPFKEVWEELQKEPEFEAQLKTKVETQLKQERAASRMKRRKKISDIFDKAKIGNQGFNSSIIPPQIWNAAVEVMKQAALAGESIANVIQQGVDYVKANNKDAWDEKAFRDEWADKLGGMDREGKPEITDEEKRQRVLDKFRKKLSGLSEEQKEEVIRKSFKKLVEAGALEYDEFKKIVASVVGLGELSAEEVSKMTGFVNDMNAVQDLSDALMKDETPENLKKFNEGVKKAEQSATKLASMLYTKAKVGQRLRSIIQLNTLGVVSLIKNPFYNIFHQLLVRFPKGVAMTIIDQAIYGASLLGNKIFGNPVIKPDVNLRLAQKGYFSKGAEGGKQAIKQVFTGLTNKDYFQKEVYNSQIKPFSAWRDLWNWGKDKKHLTKGQIADKVLQGTVGIPAEMVARMLNIGDKPFRFAAEAAIAETIARQELKLSGFELEIFLRLPKEKAKQIFIKKGMSQEEASKKAEEIEKRIINAGEEAVFQQNNVVSDVINKVKETLPKGDESHPLSSIGSGAAKLFGLLNMPFVKTPANIAWEVFNLVNPEFALFQSFAYGVKAAKTGSREDFLRSKKWMAHAATGWALLAAAGYLASIGAVSGDDEDEPYKAKEAKGKETYERPSRLNMDKLLRALTGGTTQTEDGDLNIDLTWFGAMGMIMNMQANKYENMSKEDREKMSYVDDLLFRLNRGSQDALVNSVFEGSLTAVDAIRSGRHDQWLLGMLNVGANFIEPATIAQLSRATRPTDYKITADTFEEKLQNTIKSRFFGDVTPKVNVWGDVMRREGSVRDVALRMLGVSQSDTDMFAYNVFQDFKKTGNSKFLPPSVAKTITVDGVERKLTSEQLTEFEKLVGQSRKTLVAPFVSNAATMNRKRYNQMNNDEKIDALEKLYSRGREAGKKIFLKLHPEFKSKK